MLFLSPSNTIINNSLKKYIEESTNKYIQTQTIVKKDKVFEFIKTPIKCDLCYLNDEHKLSDSEIIFLKNKFLNNLNFSKYLNCSNCSNPNEKKKSENYSHFCLYFLSTSIFFFLDA